MFSGSLQAVVSIKEWTGKMIYFNFSSIFGDFFFFKSRVIKKSQELNRKLKTMKGLDTVESLSVEVKIFLVL